MNKLIREGLEALQNLSKQIDDDVLRGVRSAEDAAQLKTVIKQREIDLIQKAQLEDLAAPTKTKDGREMVEIGGISVPKGGIRNFLLGSGALGSAAVFGPGILERMSGGANSGPVILGQGESLDPARFTADIATQEKIAQRAMDRNVRRRIANAFIGPIRAGQQLINLLPDELQGGQDMPLTEYFKYEDPNETVRERVELLDQQMDKSNLRRRQEIQTEKQGEAQVKRTEGEAEIEARQVDIINNYLKNRNIFGPQGTPTRPNRGNYQY
jgi:hypothetical protein